MPTGFIRHAASIFLLSVLQLRLVLSQTNATSIAGLLAFKTQVRDPSNVLASWQPGVPPCNSSNCNSAATSPDCNWAGLACQNWQIVALSVPCTVQPNGYAGDCALQTQPSGFPLNALAHVPTLRAIDLSGNALAGTLPPSYAVSLRQLSVLLLGGNQLTGTLPPSWGLLTTIALADFGNNKLKGPLPSAWGQWAHMRGLRVTSNFLSGQLPAEYGNWSAIQQLELGANAFTGTVPSSWAYMSVLQDLGLDYNCGLCGTLPTFPMQASSQISIATSYSSIGHSCRTNNCSETHTAVILKAVLATAATCLVLAVLIVRRWQVRRWDALGYDISGTCEMRLYNRIRQCFGLAPVAVSHNSSVSPRHSRRTDTARGLTPRRRRPKQPQPTLVIMPDGQSLCFAVRLPDSNPPPQPESSAVKQDGIEHMNYQSQDAAAQQAVVPPVPATLDSAHELAERNAHTTGQVVQTPTHSR